MRILLVSANRERLPSPVVPIGVLSVAGAVRDEHDVRVLDLCFEDDPVGTLRARLRDVRPGVVGLGLRNLHTNAYDGASEPLLEGYAALARAVREQTRAPLVVGGAAFSLRPESLLARLGADCGVVGEGEWAFREVARTLASGAAPPRLVRGAAVGAPPQAIGRRPRGELDRMPPVARDLVDPRYYAFDGTDAVQTKRGCAFDCAYCDYPDLEGRKVRVRDPERVADEVAARAARADVSCVFFVDSVFNVPRSHALAVCEALARRGAPVPWVAYVTPAGLDEEVVHAMARAGCVGVEIGSDSGTPEVLRRLRKPFDVDAIVRAHTLLGRHRILDCHTFVLGAMGETAAEAEGTLRFVEALDPYAAVFMAFTEDREERGVAPSPERDAILALLGREARRHRGWVVPELGVRFGDKITKLVAKNGLRGPSWLHLRPGPPLAAGDPLASADPLAPGAAGARLSRSIA